MQKKIKFLVLYFVLVAMVVSCSKGENSTEKPTTESTKASGTNQMSMYCDPNDRYISDAVKEYNLGNKNNPIEINEFEYAIQMDETKSKLTTALMAGEGPDIIFAFSKLFPSLRKTFESSVFYDLNSLIEKDTEFKLSDYNQIILDSGMINNKRYVLPICYRMPSLWTTKNILDKNNVHIDSSKWIWKDFFSEAKKYMDKHNGEQKYFTGYFFEPLYVMDDICGELVDNKNKKTKFNTPEFIDFLKDYKVISASICPTDIIVQQGETDKYIKSNSIITISTGGYINPRSIFDENSMLKQGLGENILLLNNPSFDERQLKSAYPERMIGINSKCKSKEKAFEFIKLLLSEEYQSRYDIQGIPVNNKGYRKAVDYYSEDFMKFEIAGGIYAPKPVAGVPLPSQVVENMDEIISSINNCQIIDYSIVEIASAEVTEYLKSVRSAEATAKIIDDKVMLYMNE